MLILIDGYNMIAPVAPPGRGRSTDWLRIERQRLICNLAVGLGDTLSRETTVVFDAAGASVSELTRLGLNDRYEELGMTIEFATEYLDADERIIELIGEHTAPKRLTVVSSDHRIQASARRRGAFAVDSEVWLDGLTEGRIALAIPWPADPKSTRRVSADPIESEKDDLMPGNVQHWLSEFGIPEDESRPRRSPESPFPKGYGEDLL